LSDKIERSVYSRRRKHLFSLAGTLRQYLVGILTEGETYFVVDSIPLDICKTSWEQRSSICKESEQTALKSISPKCTMGSNVSLIRQPDLLQKKFSPKFLAMILLTESWDLYLVNRV
jgi:hypothetical protein